MLIPLQYLIDKYHPKFKGVIHVGAHYAEEHDDYVKAGIERFVYIEPCAQSMNVLRNKFAGNEAVRLYQLAANDCQTYLPMHTASFNKGESNSLLLPHLHLQQHPEVVFDGEEYVRCARLDNELFDFNKVDYNFLAMDCQGAEGLILKGATETLKHIDYVYTEVNKGETYAGNALIEEIDELLKDFKRVETKWAGNTTWGDAFYIRKTLL